MNIKRAKQEIKDAIEAYLLKDEYGDYVIPTVRQRPVLLLGAPGIGKTQIMQQIAEETGVGLVSYTLTHHTRQSALGLPFIEKVRLGGGGRTGSCRWRSWSACAISDARTWNTRTRTDIPCAWSWIRRSAWYRICSTAS